jgi:hypothetical protein
MVRRFPDRISHDGSALPHRSWRPGGGVPCGLVHHFGVKLSTAKQDDDRNPGPDHEPDDGAQCVP